MVKFIVKQRGLIMTGTNQLEMKLHEQADQIGYLRHEVAKLKEQLEKNDAILKNLCERLYVQG
jgi:uncharacterized coiled-coil protein SlyX